MYKNLIQSFNCLHKASFVLKKESADRLRAITYTGKTRIYGYDTLSYQQKSFLHNIIL